MSFFWKSSQPAVADDRTLAFDALNRTQAMIWFDPEGTVLDANDTFLSVMGYTLDEVKGQNHRLFVSPEYADSVEYKNFWSDLGSGKVVDGDMSRLNKSGDIVWLQASYNPIVNAEGAVTKVVKLATDITEAKKNDLSAAGQVRAIWQHYAVIEFTPDGTVLNANQAFQDTMGYRLSEIKGKHHRQFVTAAYGASKEYAEFWTKLAEGQAFSGEQKRVAKNGKIVWLQANYAPILNLQGTVEKIVKYASDITETKSAVLDAAGQLDAVRETQAVIEFDMDGKVLTANDYFLSAMGYDLSEIVGRNHSIFIPSGEKDEDEYRAFWDDLRSGKTVKSDFKRAGKNGKIVWIRASYNPICDEDGRPYKVVKFANNISAQKAAIAALGECLTGFSQGDLSVRVPDDVTGDFESLKDAFNGTIEHIGELVSGILDAADAIAQDSEVIASNTNDLSTRGEQQASTIEETTAAMEEISVAVKSNAENATDSSNSAKDAAKNAEEGGSIVGEAVAAMGRIEERSAEISKIVEVIDSIAFQTNLLALNAGVEAARAGDAGKGFSVVASEVRSLAQRASEAARDINQLIDASGKEVAEGSRLVNQSGDALAEIVSSVTSVVGSIGDISTASEEQSHSIAEVTEAISQIDAATQQTAALSEESAAAATELAARATDLKQLAGFFTQSRKLQPTATPRPSKPLATKAPPETNQPAPQAAAVPQMKTARQEAVPAPEARFMEDSDEDDWQEF